MYVKNHEVSPTLINRVREISTNFYHCDQKTRKTLEDYEGILVHDGSAFSLEPFKGS